MKEMILYDIKLQYKNGSVVTFSRLFLTKRALFSELHGCSFRFALEIFGDRIQYRPLKFDHK